MNIKTDKIQYSIFSARNHFLTIIVCLILLKIKVINYIKDNFETCFAAKTLAADLFCLYIVTSTTNSSRSISTDDVTSQHSQSLLFIISEYNLSQWPTISLRNTIYRYMAYDIVT